MAVRALNQSIFRLVFAVVVLTAMTIIINVWFTIAEQTKQRLDRDLNVSQNILEQVLDNRKNLLFNSASVLTADFGFKQAVASDDIGTIKSALYNHGERIDADVMALISLDGKNIASTQNILTTGQMFPYQPLIQSVKEQGGASLLVILGEQLYQVMMITVDAPVPIAIALVGFQLDTSLVKQLHDITKLATTIQVIHQGLPEFTVSSLDDGMLQKALTQIDAGFDWFSITFSRDIPYVSRQFVLADEFDYQTRIVLSENVQQLFSEFNALQLNVIAIAVLSVLLAMLLAALFSKKLTRPLEHLANVAKRISKGNYLDTAIQQGHTKELNQLSSAFDSMQQNIQAREKEIIFQAQHDNLTSLYNRHHAGTLLEAKFAQGTPFLAIGINIFGFRGINDVFGYQNGDFCLKELASRVAKLEGLAARLTGGELLWVPDQVLSESQIQQIKIILEQPIDTGDVLINLKVAMGLLYCPQDASKAEELFKRMNIVLDEAQITKQFVLPYVSEVEERYLRRLMIITELKRALSHAQQELNLFYQPKLDFVSGKILAVEALIRWNHSTLGFVSPEDFIRVAEQAGFIHKVTDWVISRAMDNAVEFKNAGIAVTIAINLSARDVMNEELLSSIQQKLQQRGLEPNSLSFEITEGDLVKDHAKATEHLQAFKQHGFTLAIDDFGTGYSSMAYLQSLPVDCLKIDKSFVLNLDTQISDQKIVQAVLTLAHSFDLTVVAEGIENLATLKLLKDWGCEVAQGYYISRPMPAEQFVEWQQTNINKNWLS